MDLNERKSILNCSLKQDGYCIVENILSDEECNRYIAYYKSWAKAFPKGCCFQSKMSLVKNYSIGHSEGAWAARLAAKQVFVDIWNTEKLLTSIDAVAIYPPPLKQAQFYEGKSWLHCDQRATRQGLHCYQGAVYLEAAGEDDFCLRVLTRSHNCHQSFFNTFPSARRKSVEKEFYKLNSEQVKWYKDQGCSLRCVSVPKGGMVLWDSRVIHDNRLPICGKAEAGRWRFVCFVCMTPAAWASKSDLMKKRRAYESLLLTNHYPSQKMRVISDKTAEEEREMSVKELPAIAQTLEAKRLAGVEPYDFGDGQPNGAPAPVWLDQ